MGTGWQVQCEAITSLDTISAIQRKPTREDKVPATRLAEAPPEIEAAGFQPSRRTA